MTKSKANQPFKISLLNSFGILKSFKILILLGLMVLMIFNVSFIQEADKIPPKTNIKYFNPKYEFFKNSVCKEYEFDEKKCADEFVEFIELDTKLDEYFKEMVTKLNQSY